MGVITAVAPAWEPWGCSQQSCAWGPGQGPGDSGPDSPSGHVCGLVSTNLRTRELGLCI